MKIRTLRKLSGMYTDEGSLFERPPYLFEDYHTNERFKYTIRDNSIFTRVPIGGSVLAIMTDVWVTAREKL